MKKLSIPNERGQSQQRAAWGKLERSEAPDKQVEELAQQMIAGREWLFQQGYPDQSPVRKAIRDLAAKVDVTSADSWTAESAECARGTPRCKRNSRGLQAESSEWVQEATD